jgi:hypothetical protein
VTDATEGSDAVLSIPFRRSCIDSFPENEIGEWPESRSGDYAAPLQLNRASLIQKRLGLEME